MSAAPQMIHPSRLLRRRRGLSLSEVMISLAISSMLLTAIAVAYHSSSQVVDSNEKFFRASQSARVAINQMLTEIRRCDSIDDSRISSTLLPILRPAEARLPNESLRCYRYDATNQRMVFFIEYVNGSKSVEFPLAEAVQGAPFSWDMGTDANNTACVSRVSVALEVKVGSSDVRVSGSAAPRRSLSYK